MGVESFFFAGADDRFMVNLPLFHVGGTAAVYGMLVLGGSIAVVDAFDTERFWADGARHRHDHRGPARASWPAS